jgi:uncharacterized protein (DUF927 family)
MKKWVGLLMSLSLILVIGIGSVSGSFSILKKTTPQLARSEEYRIIPTQDEVEKGKTDPHMVQILKEIQRKLDEWLKSLNERIEREDVTRFEVRFLEFLRNILEWAKEKIDAKIESFEKEKPFKNRQIGLSQETHQKILPLSKMG